jgi:hypothetical protein
MVGYRRGVGNDGGGEERDRLGWWEKEEGRWWLWERGGG